MKQLLLPFMHCLGIHAEDILSFPSALAPAVFVELRQRLAVYDIDLWAALKEDWLDPTVHTFTQHIDWQNRYTKDNRLDIIKRAVRVAIGNLTQKISDAKPQHMKTAFYVSDLTCTAQRDTTTARDSLTFSIDIIYG